MRKNKAIFITGTDTHVGKTIATLVLGTLYKAQGYNVGVMKPVQCAGNDAAFLKEALNIDDHLMDINPCYAPEPLSPHLAFHRAGKRVNMDRIFRSFARLCLCHDLLLIEGAGGLMVPLKKNYYNADLIHDLKAEVIIIARLGLGTINHTLLTVHQAKAHGLKIKGILFSDTNPNEKSIAERTNPVEIQRLSKVKVLGTIPYLKHLSEKEILRQCKAIPVD
ncbi:MAG: dethiobiotin synthase [Candidatus Omnitrophica bacterium]|nr:dethiobiotin synthase [Candidatus Omnitrophota bacterium]